MFKLLLIEDDMQYSNKLSSELKSSSYEVVHVNNPIEGIANLALQPFDGMILCSSRLSDQDITMLKTVQNMKPQLKTFILSQELVPELELQAINEQVRFCIEKDRNIAVITAYINREMRIPLLSDEPPQPDRLISQSNHLIIDQMARKIFIYDKEVKVSQKEYEILRLLLANREKPLSREEIVSRIWNVDIEKISPRAIDGHIKRLRTKLHLKGIVTIRRFGYKWTETV